MMVHTIALLKYVKIRKVVAIKETAFLMSKLKSPLWPAFLVLVSIRCWSITIADLRGSWQVSVQPHCYIFSSITASALPRVTRGIFRTCFCFSILAKHTSAFPVSLSPLYPEDNHSFPS